MTNEKQNLSVGGKISIAEKSPAFRDATAHIYLEDVSRADAESNIIAEAKIENLDHSDKVTEIPFRLEIADASLIDPKRFYSIRVWIETEQGANDLYSDRAYRVLTHGFGDYIEIQL